MPGSLSAPGPESRPATAPERSSRLEIAPDRERHGDDHCVDPAWAACRFSSCSVLPVRFACNLRCRFCFSKSSISALRRDTIDWRRVDLEGYYAFSRERGATRLVITGGGEPLLRPDDVVYLIERGRRHFDEITCFTNGTYLTAELARRLADAGLSYLCYSRHSDRDDENRDLMGDDAPALDEFFTAVGDLPVRATCVMARGHIDSRARVLRYIAAMRERGVIEMTFKHTYTAYPDSVFAGSPEDRWARQHQVQSDPFASDERSPERKPALGAVIARLPWGPEIRRIDHRSIAVPGAAPGTAPGTAPGSAQVCYYYEPTPAWEKEHRLCRSSNLLSDGTVYASLEEKQSRLYRLKPC